MKSLFILFVKLNKSSLEKPCAGSVVHSDQTSFWKRKQRCLLSTSHGKITWLCTFFLQLYPADKHLNSLQRRVLGAFMLQDISPQSTPSP